MSVVRAFAWLLVATSVGAVLLTVSWVGRHLDVDPDLGPEQVVTVPVRSGSDGPGPSSGPPATPGATPSGPTATPPGARTDPARPLPGGDRDDTDSDDRRPDTDDGDDDLEAPDSEPDDPADDD